MLTDKSPFLSAPVRALGEIGALFKLAARKERRRHPRLPAAMTGEMSLRRSDLGLPEDTGADGKTRASIPVRIREMSRGGLGLSIESQDLPRGNLSLLGMNLDALPTRIPVTVRLESVHGPIVVRGEVTSRELREPSPHKLAVAVGMSFQPSEELPRALLAWIAEASTVFTRAVKALRRRTAGLPVARELVAAIGFVGLADEQLESLIHRAAQALGLEPATATATAR